MSECWPIVLTVSGLAIASLFGRAIRGHFVSQKLPHAMKILVALSYLAVLVYLFALWTGAASLSQRIVGLSLQSFSAIFFNWARTTTLGNRFTAAFDTDKPTFLVKTGPYRFVRHPFYVSYVSFWVGSSLAAGSWMLWCLCILLVVSYVVAALLEEKKFKELMLAADYQFYATEVGFFFPKLSALARERRLEGRRRRDEDVLEPGSSSEPRA